jgi:dephospho-CoA kinase
MNKKRLIGLTGGIATGKSTVAHYLADKYQIPILDADLYAREAVAKDSPILADIFARYGADIKLPDGSLNRQQLGEIIFNNSLEKQWLESKIHPSVREKIERQLNCLNQQIIALVIPLLMESNMADLVTEIWVVSCSYEEQIRRLIARNNLTEEQAIARIKSQLPTAEKIALADFVLDNSSTREYLFQQIDEILGSAVE